MNKLDELLAELNSLLAEAEVLASRTNFTIKVIKAKIKKTERLRDEFIDSPEPVETIGYSGTSTTTGGTPHTLTIK